MYDEKNKFNPFVKRDMYVEDAEKYAVKQDYKVTNIVENVVINGSEVYSVSCKC